MKSYFYLLLFLNLSFSQSKNNDKLVGIWQFNSKEISSGWFDNYQFFKNGKFIFNNNQNDLTKRIISIGGTYKIEENKIILTITYSKEIKGGYLFRSQTAGGSGWEIEGGKVILLKYVKPKISYLTIEECNEDVIPCILIDKRLYYKLEENPLNY